MTPARIAMAVIAGILLLLFPVAGFAGAAAGYVLMILVIVGVAVSFGALEKNMRNPWYVWLIAGLHSALALLFLILVVVGINNR